MKSNPENIVQLNTNPKYTLENPSKLVPGGEGIYKIISGAHTLAKIGISAFGGHDWEEQKKDKYANVVVCGFASGTLILFGLNLDTPLNKVAYAGGLFLLGAALYEAMR